ncbi:MAG: glycosyltransferase [Sideroxydans sp.]|nr:glycosyltransferase [Sideroxydans sp.]
MIKVNKLRVVHIAEDVSAVAGGVPAVVRQLSTRLAHQGVQVQIVHALGERGALPTAVESFAFPSKLVRRAWSWGDGLRAGIARLADAEGSASPVFHLHGIWSAPHYFAAKIAHESGMPFIVTAHGMLEPWLWEQQGWRIRIKKQVYWNMFAYPALKTAAVVHAITPMEQQNLHVLFPKNRIEVIPNAIDINEMLDMDGAYVEREPIILFLGRIEPKKGVDILLNAFARSTIAQKWRVVIIGPVWSKVYQTELDRIVAENHLGERVAFLGPVFGEEKVRWLRKAWVMAVPSHSEVVGLVNLEAAVYGLPTITSHQTGLFDWESGGGILIHPNITDMQTAIEKACSWTESEQKDRGEQSRVLVEKRYSWNAIMPLWMSLYNSIQIKG